MFEKITNSFVKTFIAEDKYKLFLDGLAFVEGDSYIVVDTTKYILFN